MYWPPRLEKGLVLECHGGILGICAHPHMSSFGVAWRATY